MASHKNIGVGLRAEKSGLLFAPQLLDFKEHKPQVPQNSQGSKNNAEDIPGGHVKRLTQGQPEGQENSLLQSPPVQPASSRLVTRNDSRVSRFTRTVNSLQARRENEDQRVPPHDQELKNTVGHDPPGVMDKKTPTVKVLVANEQVSVHSWQDIVNKVNAKMTEAEKKNGVSNAVTKSDRHPTENRKHGLPQQGNHKMEADVESELDAGMIDREETLQSQKQHVGQDTLVPEEVVDPAKDPNNQGEDEFEEAEIDRPEFEEKGEVGKNAVYEKAEQKVVFLQAADAKMKSREEPEEPYQDDQEQDIV
ncbi:Golgi integral membrane protein 4-like [Bufo gargarizans]|uniref:Golgi integral membrane protein 4-like n=1 Tax=Bufo gargarizans TaxID=30331 RepID=UPI001CF3933C|nr:Golgi integral membrane protein 4-like [Bufo gargarizans]